MIFVAGSVLALRFGGEFWWILYLLWAGAINARNQLYVYEGGVYAHTSTIPWSAIRGWAFGQEGTRMYLFLWNDSPWRYLNAFLFGRSWRQSVRVELLHTPELAAILRALAPERANRCFR